MNQLLASAKAELDGLEERLRALMRTAIDDKDYEDLQTVARWASRVAGIAEENPHPTHVVTSKAKSTRRKTRPKSVSAKGAKYPKFARNGDRLVKISWSKTRKSAYTHHAPRQIVLLLMQRMREAAPDDGLIVMASVLPLVDDGVEVPSYQSYLALAWLRSIGVVAQHGKQGYSIHDADLAPGDLDTEWQCLPAYEGRETE